MTLPPRRAQLRRLLAIGAATLAVAGGAGVAVAVITDQPAPPAAHSFGDPTSQRGPAASARSGGATPAAAPSAGPTARSSSSRGPAPQHGAGARPSALDAARPVRLEIPAIGASRSFVKLGIMSNGELATPSDPATVGWFDGGASPGAAGVAVVAGHVTWNGAEAAFFKLADLRRGDLVRVKRNDGLTAIFRVRAMGTYPKNRFPTEQVYRRSQRPELVMITCGGDYSRERHYYDSNVIVWADFVGGQRSRR